MIKDDADITNITIDLPLKLYQLISEMAKISNKELNTALSAQDLISKLAVQYFGTRNSIDIMCYSLSKLPELLENDKEEIMKLNDEFNQTVIKFDEICTRTNKKFHAVIDKLETLNH